MLEIGKDSEAKHRETGAYAATKAAVVIAVGPLSEHTAQGAENNGAEVYRAENVEAAAEILKAVSKPGDTVLLKASHSMHIGSVADQLKSH